MIKIKTIRTFGRIMMVWLSIFLMVFHVFLIYSAFINNNDYITLCYNDLGEMAFEMVLFPIILIIIIIIGIDIIREEIKKEN